jgi:hypothetical protein
MSRYPPWAPWMLQALMAGITRLDPTHIILFYLLLLIFEVVL